MKFKIILKKIIPPILIGLLIGLLGANIPTMSKNNQKSSQAEIEKKEKDQKASDYLDQLEQQSNGIFSRGDVLDRGDIVAFSKIDKAYNILKNKQDKSSEEIIIIDVLKSYLDQVSKLLAGEQNRIINQTVPAGRLRFRNKYYSKGLHTEDLAIDIILNNGLPQKYKYLFDKPKPKKSSPSNKKSNEPSSACFCMDALSGGEIYGANAEQRSKCRKMYICFDNANTDCLLGASNTWDKCYYN
tara:strand:+ start:30 stop:755 length:726 start_codon:yes stop_codon:yes gene_type:complete